MIFLTVGSMFPFDRLIRGMDELVSSGAIAEPVHAQIGDGRYEPRHMPFDRFLDKPAFERRLAEANLLIAHAGAGTIQQALSHRKPLLVVPRLSRHHEHVNDHQVATARKFEELGHVLVAQDVGSIPQMLGALRSFVPLPRDVKRIEVARRIDLLLRSLTSRSSA